MWVVVISTTLMAPSSEPSLVQQTTVWTAFEESSDLRELASFAILLLTVVVNQAGCKRHLCDLKIKQTQRRKSFRSNEARENDQGSYVIVTNMYPSQCYLGWCEHCQRRSAAQSHQKPR